MLRSLWAWAAITTLIVTWLPLLAVIRLFDRDPAHYRTGYWFRRLGCYMTRVNPSWRVQVSGYRVDDPRRPYVVVSNHQSLADIPVISCLPWEMKWVAKSELFRIPFVGWMMRLAGDIEVDRADPKSRSRVLLGVRRYLQNKCSVMFFPEGTRSRDGRVLDFNEGAFMLAIKEQIPILPVVVDGTRGALPKHSWRFGEAPDVRVHVLPPVETTGLTRADGSRICREIRARIIEELASWRGLPVTAVDASTPPTKAEQREPNR